MPAIGITPQFCFKVLQCDTASLEDSEIIDSKQLFMRWGTHKRMKMTDNRGFQSRESERASCQTRSLTVAALKVSIFGEGP